MIRGSCDICATGLNFGCKITELQEGKENDLTSMREAVVCASTLVLPLFVDGLLSLICSKRKSPELLQIVANNILPQISMFPNLYNL